jgi:hypothetical protein
MAVRYQARVTPKQLARKFAKAKRGESIRAAMTRSLAFARAMIGADHEDVLVEGMSPMYSTDRIANVQKAIAAAAATPKLAGKARGLLVQAKQRYGAPLPETLHELWTLLGSPPHRAWLRAFCVRSFVDPAQLIPPPAGAKDAKLTTMWNKDRTSFSDTRERFVREYEQWFAKADPTVKVSSGAQLAKHALGDFVMLDPALRQDLISFARASSEHWFVVPALASAKYPAPVFSNHDDGEGYSELHAKDVRAWFSDEISRSIRAAVEQE